MTLTKILQECSVLEEKGKAKMTADAWGESLILIIIFIVVSTGMLWLQNLPLFFLDSILSHLTFPHTWVRLMASRLFGLLFSQHSPEDLIQLSKENSTEEYLAIDIGKKV